MTVLTILIKVATYHKGTGFLYQFADELEGNA